MPGSERARQRVIQHYLACAQKAERQRMEAEAKGDTYRAALLTKAAAFWWVAAEYAPILPVEIEEGPGAHHLQKRFLTAVVGDDAVVGKTGWTALHRFLVSAALEVLPTKDAMVALLAHVGLLDERQIAFELWLTQADVHKRLNAVRSTWRRLVTGQSPSNAARRKRWGKAVDTGSEFKRRVVEALEVYGALTTSEITVLLMSEGDGFNQVRMHVLSELNWLKCALRVQYKRLPHKGGEPPNARWSLVTEFPSVAAI